MAEENRLAAAIMAVEASRQESATQGGTVPPKKDVKAEIWKNYQFFMGKLTGGERFVSRLISDGPSG
jgi:hypothetical protein